MLPGPMCTDLAQAFDFGQNQPAHWMSGNFGVGFRIPGGDWLERRVENGWGLEWQKVVNQVVAVNASWVIINLSAGAFADRYMAYNPHISDINSPPNVDCIPGEGGGGWGKDCLTAVTPTDPELGGVDYFQDMMDSFHDANIRVIAYMASQGPAMFKAGTAKSFDHEYTLERRPDCIETEENVGPKACFDEPDNCCSIALGNWIRKVRDVDLTDVDANFVAGTIDYPKLHAAFAIFVVGYYAEKYSSDIDGWWFDHADENQEPSCAYGSTCKSDFLDEKLIVDAIRRYQPNVPMTFNGCSQKSPLKMCSAHEDFTSGHPTPLNGKIPTRVYDDQNYLMITSIEGTPDGFFVGEGGSKSLGHIYMPTGDTWNGAASPNVWTAPEPYFHPYDSRNFNWSKQVTEENGWNPNATEWFTRALNAGGAWTWNVPRQSNKPNTYYLLHPNHMEIIQIVSAELMLKVTVTPTTVPTSIDIIPTSLSPQQTPVSCMNHPTEETEPPLNVDMGIVSSGCSSKDWLIVSLISMITASLIQL